MPQDEYGIARYVSSSLQLAILLEVSAHKPGNVNPIVNFEGTRYEHFLASAVAVEPSFAQAAERGISVARGKVKPDKIHIGKAIKDAIISISFWQHGGNTLLGTVMLLAPISAAAGITLAERKSLSLSKLRRNIEQVVKSTIPSDAVALYEAIRVANPTGLVDKAPTLDVNDPKSVKRILEEKITLHDVFKISAQYDSISKEWTENYPITFEIGLPYFAHQLRRTDDLNMAIVHTFLRILSMIPDTLIARKAGLEKAKEISKRAGEILRSGGLETSMGREDLSNFDNELRESGNRCNPGTTADITAAVLAVSVLNGYRP